MSAPIEPGAIDDCPMPNCRRLLAAAIKSYAARAETRDEPLPALRGRQWRDGDRGDAGRFGDHEGGQRPGLRTGHVAVLVGTVNEAERDMDLPLSDYRKMAVAEFDTTKLLAHAAQQAKERGYERFPIVDVNSPLRIRIHNGNSRLSRRSGAASAHAERGSGQCQNNGVLPTGVGYQDIGGRVTRYPLRKMEKTEGPQHRDVALTKRWMDCMGTDIAILFPTPMLQLGVHPQVEIEIALAHAYNRWLSEKVLSEGAAHQVDAVSAVQRSRSHVPNGAGIRQARRRLWFHGDRGALQAGAS